MRKTNVMAKISYIIYPESREPQYKGVGKKHSGIHI